MDIEEIREALQDMESDPNLITLSAYRANADLWPGNRISFVDSHLAYMKANPGVEPRHYLSNLRLRIKKTIQLR